MGDDVFDGFLDEATHRAGAHFGVVAAFDEDLFGLGGQFYGYFLIGEGFVGRGNDEV